MPFRRVFTNDRVLEQIQTNVGQAIDPLLSQADAKGNIITVQVFSSGDNIINHGLGRRYTHWELMDSDSFVQLKTSATENNSKEKQVIIVSNANATISLKVF